MGKKSFRTLRMVESPMTNTAPRGTDGEASTIKKIPRAISILGSFINNLRREKRRDMSQGVLHSHPFSSTLY